MKPYELTYIISSEITSQDAENIKKEIEAFVQEKGGVILKSEKTVPQVLAYPIKKQSSGYFATLEFQIEEKEIKGLKEKLEKDAKILRHFVIVKKPVKERKERRIRKPSATTEHKQSSFAEVLESKEKIKSVKVELDDIEKKLDEILSE